jgi:hypothetical protein
VRVLGDFGSPLIIRLDEAAIFLAMTKNRAGVWILPGSNVRFGSLADIGEGYQGCPLYPPEANMLIVGINVCYVPKADVLGEDTGECSPLSGSLRLD